MRSACVWAAVAVVATSARAESGSFPAVEAVRRAQLDRGGHLVVGTSPGASGTSVCRVDPRGASLEWPEADIEKRGGTTTREDGDDFTSRCATVPPTELAFALWTALRVPAARSGAPPADAPDDEGFTRNGPHVRLARLASPLSTRTDRAPTFVVAVATALPAEDVFATARKHVAKVEELEDAPPLEADPGLGRQATERFSTSVTPGTEPEAHFAWTLPGATVEECARGAIAFEIIAGGATSRLQKSLVGHGLARAVVPFALGAEDGVLFGLDVVPAGLTSVDRVRRFVDGSLKQLRVVGPTARELRRAVARLELGALLTWENPGLRARALGHAELVRGDARRFVEEALALSRVTPDHVRRLAAERLDNAHRATLELYPKDHPSDDPRLAHHRVHVVVSGDSLAELAKRYGVSLGAIVRANDLDPARALSIGQPLFVPPPSPAR